MGFRPKHTQLLSGLKFNKSRQGMQGADQVMNHVMTKCARHAATFLKLYLYTKASNENIVYTLSSDSVCKG